MTNQKLADILEWEIARLHELSKQGPLDIADLTKLEKLISACSKFKPVQTDDSHNLDALSTAELLNGLSDLSKRPE